MDLKANYILDLRGMITPITLLNVTQIFREMKSGEILEILGRDQDTKNDLFKVLPSSSYELVSIENLQEELSYRIKLKKNKK